MSLNIDISFLISHSWGIVESNSNKKARGLIIPLQLIIKKKTCYINYLPLWNFIIFIILPKNTILGPITGTIVKRKLSYLEDIFKKINEGKESKIDKETNEALDIFLKSNKLIG